MGHGIWAMRSVLEGLGLRALVRSQAAKPGRPVGLDQRARARGLGPEGLGLRAWARGAVGLGA